MSKQAYNGAYSRRRYSNYTGDPTDDVKPDFHIETSDPIDLKKVTLKVSWNGAMGRVNGSGNFQISPDTPACEASATVISGTSVALTATPLDGYHFVGWRGVPVEGVTSQSVNVKVAADYNVTAVFAPDTPVDHKEPSGNGGNVPQITSQGGGIVDQVKPFVKKWWWAILIVAFIAYKEWKGGKQ